MLPSLVLRAAVHIVRHQRVTHATLPLPLAPMPLKNLSPLGRTMLQVAVECGPVLLQDPRGT
eukprot:1461849-Rhodomonas_salina.2